MRVAPSIVLTADDRSSLEHLSHSRSTAYRIVQRSQMILMAADGKTNLAIATALRIDVHTVARWRGRVLRDGVQTLERDAPRPGRTPSIAPEVVASVLQKTTCERPTDATDWSSRSMAKATGLSPATILRIWRRHGLKPHLIRTFKLSNDPHFEAKLTDVIGLYLNPPEHAIVLSLDEKSQIPAAAGWIEPNPDCH